jgi:hypothetical protein
MTVYEVFNIDKPSQVITTIVADSFEQAQIEARRSVRGYTTPVGQMQGRLRPVGLREAPPTVAPTVVRAEERPQLRRKPRKSRRG